MLKDDSRPSRITNITTKDNSFSTYINKLLRDHNMKTALITGCLGQDGSYLLDFFLGKNYRVIGVKRRSSTSDSWRIRHILDHPNLEIIDGDITDIHSVNSIVNKYKPDKLVNTAAMSMVQTSFGQPSYCMQTNAGGVINLLEAIYTFSPHTRFINCFTSEGYGKNYDIDENGHKYQDEYTRFDAQSPYAFSKIASYYVTKFYRDNYKLHASSAITFNHEGLRRSVEFVTRKITEWIGRYITWRDDTRYTEPISFDREKIYCGNNKFDKLRLGSLSAFRDWSDARDIVRAFDLMMDQDIADDYVLASGTAHSVREFLNLAFSIVNITNWSDYVVYDEDFVRKAEVDYLCGRSDKAKRVLGWEPQISFEQMVKDMVEADIERAKNG